MEIAQALKEGRDIYICGDCAEAAGGVWPQGHAATWHQEWPCDACGKGVPICALSDWEWPGRDGVRMRGMRE